MALFLPGMRCGLCEKPMTAADELVSFRPFVADRCDPLYIFSDATVHAACFAQHPLSDEATRWHDVAMRYRTPADRTCVACSQLILDPDDFFGTGLLSRDPNNPLYCFNFVHLHLSHAARWEQFDEFRRRVESAQASDAWQRPRLVFGTTPIQTLRWVVDDKYWERDKP